MLAFDTDMIGPYGYCADLSRSWTIGHTPMTAHQRESLRGRARSDRAQHVGCCAGLGFREFNEKSWRIPDKYLSRR